MSRSLLTNQYLRFLQINFKLMTDSQLNPTQSKLDKITVCMKIRLVFLIFRMI